jgi:hypothetical protein
MHPTITESRVIGTFAGEPMHAWTERDADGALRFFEDYATTVFSPSIGRHIGLTMVREVAA